MRGLDTAALGELLFDDRTKMPTGKLGTEGVPRRHSSDDQLQEGRGLLIHETAHWRGCECHALLRMSTSVKNRVLVMSAPQPVVEQRLELALRQHINGSALAHALAVAHSVAEDGLLSRQTMTRILEFSGFHTSEDPCASILSACTSPASDVDPTRLFYLLGLDDDDEASPDSATSSRDFDTEEHFAVASESTLAAADSSVEESAQLSRPVTDDVTDEALGDTDGSTANLDTESRYATELASLRQQLHLARRDRRGEAVKAATEAMGRYRQQQAAAAEAEALGGVFFLSRLPLDMAAKVLSYLGAGDVARVELATAAFLPRGDQPAHC